MPLAKDYECFSVRMARQKHGQYVTDALQEAGLRCKVSSISVERIAHYIAKRIRVKLKKVYVKDTKYGSGGNRCITLPHWVLHRMPKPYIVYYVAHEVAHLHPNGNGHEKSFKRVERRALKLFGIGIRYVHAYPRELYVLRGNQAGNVLWVDSKYRAAQIRNGHPLPTSYNVSVRPKGLISTASMGLGR